MSRRSGGGGGVSAGLRRCLYELLESVGNVSMTLEGDVRPYCIIVDEVGESHNNNSSGGGGGDSSDERGVAECVLEIAKQPLRTTTTTTETETETDADNFSKRKRFHNNNSARSHALTLPLIYITRDAYTHSLRELRLQQSLSVLQMHNSNNNR